jgi:hypothetical protein
MSAEEDGLGEARQRLTELFDADDWEVTESAVTAGLPILRRMGNAYPTRAALIDYVLDLLRADFPMHTIQRGDPPGSLSVGYVMNNSDGLGLYIELAIEEVRMGQPRAWLLSFHTSKHYRA